MENEIIKTTVINFEIDWSKPTILIETNWWVLGPIIIISVAGYLIWLYKIKQNFSVHELSVDISAKPKMTFKVKRNTENLFIANRIYLELVTRKAALPFDEANDAIVEVYDSWYTLFTTIREEIKNVPGEYLKSHNPTEELIGLTVNILNDGLRNHLTKYQARFRKWYKIESEKTENLNLSPQDLQKLYSDYNNLITDLKAVNIILISYSEELKILIKG